MGIQITTLTNHVSADVEKSIGQCVWPFFEFLDTRYYILVIILFSKIVHTDEFFRLYCGCKLQNSDYIMFSFKQRERKIKLANLFSFQDKMIWLWLKQISVVSMISVKLIFKRKSIHTA